MKLTAKIVFTGTLAVGLIMSAIGYLIVSGIDREMTRNLDNWLAGDAKFAAARINEKPHMSAPSPRPSPNQEKSPGTEHLRKPGH
ncbi:hypothetical protein [Aliamphritea spongicola]|nr:hypothetical protein [Aliamphritea spongicola]